MVGKTQEINSEKKKLGEENKGALGWHCMRRSESSMLSGCLGKSGKVIESAGGIGERPQECGTFCCI